MKLFRALSLILVTVAACGGSNEPKIPILSANGTISLDGRNVVPTYAVAGFDQSGKSAYVVLSDAAMGCSMLDEDYLRNHIPAAGTYVFVGLPGFDKGVDEHGFVDFTVVSKGGSNIGTGSSDGKVEVLDATDTAVTIRVDYRHTLEALGGEGVVNGEFSATRCPAP